jgi:hypothetical protein
VYNLSIFTNKKLSDLEAGAGKLIFLLVGVLQSAVGGLYEGRGRVEKAGVVDNEARLQHVRLCLGRKREGDRLKCRRGRDSTVHVVEVVKHSEKMRIIQGSG